MEVTWSMKIPDGECRLSLTPRLAVQWSGTRRRAQTDATSTDRRNKHRQTQRALTGHILFEHAHEIESVEAVDDRSAEMSAPENRRRMAFGADRLQLVGAPRELGVTGPGVAHHLRGAGWGAENRGSG